MPNATGDIPLQTVELLPLDGNGQDAVASDQPLRSTAEEILFRELEAFPSGKQGKHLWSSSLDELLEIRGLETDWDGDGAAAPGTAITDAAVRLATRLRSLGCPAPHHTAPGVNGTVLFDWFSPTVYVEIEVESPTDVELFITQVGAKESKMIRWE